MTVGEGPGGRERARRRRERILDTAIRLFLEEGIRAVGVYRIVDEAGVALMTLYRHFGGKDGLVVAGAQQGRGGAGTVERRVGGGAGRPGGPLRGRSGGAVRRGVGGAGAAPGRGRRRWFAGCGRGRRGI